MRHPGPRSVRPATHEPKPVGIVSTRKPWTSTGSRATHVARTGDSSHAWSISWSSKWMTMTHGSPSSTGGYSSVDW